MGVTLNFDANTVQPAKAFEPLPAAFYNAKIVESEMKPTKDGQGAYLELQLEILDGQFAGRKLFDRLNLQNNNQVAVEIAYRTLSAICHATGVIQVADSSQLHGLPLTCKVALKPASTGNDGKQYEPSNEIKGYKPLDSTMQAPPQSAGFARPNMQPATAPAVAAAPWNQPAAPQVAIPPAFSPGPATPPWQGAQHPVQPPTQPAPQAPMAMAGAPASPTPPWARK